MYYVPRHRSRSDLAFLCNVTATTDFYTLSLHDALPISSLDDHHPIFAFIDFGNVAGRGRVLWRRGCAHGLWSFARRSIDRSEEHTSELQSRPHLVCRLLLEKKNTRLAALPARAAPAPDH